MVSNKHRFMAPLFVCGATAAASGGCGAALRASLSVLVAFASTSGESFELRAVSLEDASRLEGSELTARR
jgi:hypothetical protein